MTEHPNVATVNAMTAAIVGQDHDSLAKIFTDDFVLHMRGPVPPAGDHSGVGGLLEGIGSLFELTDGEVDLDQQVCVGVDGWAFEWEHATLARNLKTLESKDAFVYRFDGDRIAEMWMFFGVLPEVAETFFA
ncbi:MAG: nuclear transport factor 2 family protein [Acidimicrobiales bacterium]